REWSNASRASACPVDGRKLFPTRADDPSVYAIGWSDEALDDFERLDVRYQRVIRVAVEELRYQPTAPATLHRKPLAEPIDELGELAWELQVGSFRVFFSADEEARTVTVLRVILKGRWTTAHALRRSRRS